MSDPNPCSAAYFFFGGVLMILGSIGEWIVGNTFPFVVFGTFGKPPSFIPPSSTLKSDRANNAFRSFLGAFWLTFGGTLVPSFNAYGAYVTTPAQMAGQDGNPGNPLGLQTPGFNASFAFFLLFMGESAFHRCSIQRRYRLTHVSSGLVCFIFLICSLRTNVVFFLIFLSLIGAFGCLAGAYWNLALAYENAANTMAAKRAGRLVVVSFPPESS